MRQRRHRIDISIDEAFKSLVSERWLKGIVRRVVEAEAVSRAELGVVITDDGTVRRLNRDYAGQEAITDVLSFRLNEGEPFVSPPDGMLRLGEVVIAYPRAQRQAAEQGRSVEMEVAHLLIHGVLHLLGYDHAEPAEERRMRAREEELLRATFNQKIYTGIKS